MQKSTCTPDIIAEEFKNGNYSHFEELQKQCIFIPKTICDAANKIGLEKSDLWQEASIALLNSLHSFCIENGNFKSFASKCIRNRLISILRTGYRQKNVAMLEYVPIDDVDLFSEHDPENDFIDKENFKDKNIEISKILSTFENNVLKYYLQNKSYSEIAKKLSVSEKSVGNALCRIRKKLR